MAMQMTQLTHWTRRLVASWGYRTDDAEFLTDTLIEANLRGIDSHGVMRLPVYKRRVDAGLIDPTATPEVTSHGSVITIDARRAAGQIAARAATDEVARAARETGVASATVSGSAHFGTAGYYARRLAEQGFVAFVVSNSEPIVVPFGGRQALLGTNPFAFAAPGPDHPISLDMATSTSAMGKVLLAQAAGRCIPRDWGVDENGNPTTDPNQVVALLPAAGPKGYGLGFLVEVLGGVLSGAAVAGGIGNMYADFDRPQNVGHWMLALDIAAVTPLADFMARMSDLVDQAHATPPTDDGSKVLVPGEPEERTRAVRLRDGIELPESVIADLSALGDQSGVSFPKESVA